MSRPSKHFLDIKDLDGEGLRGLLATSRAMKTKRAGRPRGEADGERLLDGRLLAMIFEKPSTRTRVSFDVAMRQLGGSTLILAAEDMQLGRGETISDTAKVLSRYVDAIMIRANSHRNLTELAEHATVPVINGLTDLSHPCQVMADLLTVEEKKGPIEAQTVAWTGDVSNVANSWIHAAARLGFELRLAFPEELAPDPKLVSWARECNARIHLTHDAQEAVSGADCVVTDTWVSMSVDEPGSRHNLLKPYQVNEALMARAKGDAIFLHCLPAHRGEEVTAEVIDGPRSVIFDEAENRLHIQKGILAWCLGGPM
ncbi:ornithine carbamoyltransferase [Kaustia mangrovi]|uniref:Ornithine carbamoyltransferase n=1 Tax=Kaustia mangrovi TaxID=2593653 RepID=A0A7S8HCL6_9HYPH|nr:ornithine carbamoyltransferase [Kaustia mangrovi]QPC43574.1 ornithine carbamoyltransferase [Kaustia mangrovi]